MCCSPTASPSPVGVCDGSVQVLDLSRLTTLQAFRQVIRNEGFFGLYKGVSAGACGAV